MTVGFDSRTSICSFDIERCEHNKSPTLLQLKLAAIFSIFTACLMGVCLPVLGPRFFKSFSTKSKLFVFLKSFSAGVVLGTGFIHMLPDAFEIMSSSCLSGTLWQKFPFAGVTAMTAALGTLLLDLIGTALNNRRKPANGAAACPGHITGRNDVTSIEELESQEMSSSSSERASSMQLRYTVIAEVLELGMVAHSIIIGLSLGTSHSVCTIRPLVAALTFHQLFEGLALGGCLSQAAFKSVSVMFMTLLFSVTTPIGIAVGIGIASGSNSPKAMVVEGLLDAVSAGILIYMALVDLIATDFLSNQEAHDFRIQLVAYIALVCGASAMAMLAVWA